MHLRTLLKATAGLAVGVIVMAGCSSNAATGSSSTSGGKVGLDQPRSDSDFWNAYAKYVPQKAKSLNVDLMPVTTRRTTTASSRPTCRRWSRRAPRPS